MKMEHTMEVRCSPEHLWPFLEEPEKQKLWMKGLLANERTGEGPRGAGSTFRMKIKEGRKVAEYHGEVTAHDPPRHLGVRIWGGALPKGCVMKADYRLTPVAELTRLDYVAEMQAERLGWFLRLLMPLIKLFGRMQLRGFMKQLKRLAEAPAAG
jgi:carbon monoxide dehydrogenase subunit G